MTDTPQIYILTGPKNSGKSTFLENTIPILQDKGLTYSGIGTIPVYEDQKKTGFKMINLVTREEHLLCQVKPEENWFHSGRFFFNPGTIDLGKKILSDALQNRMNLIIIDEFGPLELNGGGWNESVKTILRQSQTPILMVVREEILDEVNFLFRDLNLLVFHKTDSTPEGIAEQIFKDLQPA